jgi:hypothetical protein
MKIIVVQPGLYIAAIAIVTTIIGTHTHMR